MFNIGFSELIVVLLIAFLVVGPKDLPKVARWLGRMVKKLKQLIREVKQETGWDDLEKELKDTKASVTDLKKDLDVTSELKGATADLNKSLNSVKDELHQTGKEIQAETREIEKETIGGMEFQKIVKPAGNGGGIISHMTAPLKPEGNISIEVQGYELTDPVIAAMLKSFKMKPAEPEAK